MKIRKTKTILLFISLIIILAVLSGCFGIPNPPKENGLKEGFKNSSEVLNFYSAYEIVSFEIDKRQTNKDGKEDTVFCTVVMKNEAKELTMECIMYYSYYDVGGWELQYVNIQNTNYRLLREVIVADLEHLFDEYIERKFEGWGEKRPILGKNENSFKLDMIDNEQMTCELSGQLVYNGAMVITVDVTMNCWFDVRTGRWNAEVDEYGYVKKEKVTYDYRNLLGQYHFEIVDKFGNRNIGFMQITDYDKDGVYYEINIQYQTGNYNYNSGYAKRGDYAIVFLDFSLEQVRIPRGNYYSGATFNVSESGLTIYKVFGEDYNIESFEKVY